MELIDYDKLFSKKLDSWLRANRAKYEKPDMLEAEIERIYFEWMEENKSAFSSFSGRELIEYLVAYSESNVSVPDLLCDEIVKKKDEAEGLLFSLLSNGALNREAVMLAVNLLMQMGSEVGSELFVDWILNGGEEDELADIATEALQEMKNLPAAQLKKAFYSADTSYSRERLADCLSCKTDDDEVFVIMRDMFLSSPEAMTAIRLARTGDERGINIMTEQLKKTDIDYVSFVEIKNAIESLGGNVDFMRDFSGDEYYEKMKKWEKL